MLTLKRKCVIAQAVLSVYNEAGEWVNEIECPPMRLTASQEQDLARVVDRMLRKACDELNASGQAAQVEGANGEGAGV